MANKKKKKPSKVRFVHIQHTELRDEDGPLKARVVDTAFQSVWQRKGWELVPDSPVKVVDQDDVITLEKPGEQPVGDGEDSTLVPLDPDAQGDGSTVAADPDNPGGVIDPTDQGGDPDSEPTPPAGRLGRRS